MLDKAAQILYALRELKDLVALMLDPTAGISAYLRTRSVAAPSQSPFYLLAASDNPTTAPTSGEDGVSIEGHLTLNFAYKFVGTSAASASITLYLYDSERWWPWGTLPTGTSQEGVLDPFDAEGWQRVYAKVNGSLGPSDYVELSVFPYNAE